MTEFGWILEGSSSFCLDCPSLSTSSAMLLGLAGMKAVLDSLVGPENPKAGLLVEQLEVEDPRIPVLLKGFH